MSDESVTVPPARGGSLPDRQAGASGGKKPGIVIFIAILQFFSSSLFFLLSLFSVLALVFGAAWGIDDYVSKQVAQHSPNPNFSYGVTVIFGIAASIFLALMVFFFCLGIGLLKGKKFAWYLQVAVSIFGLLMTPLTFLWNVFTLPIGAVLNVVILVFFFQPRVRDFFKV
jgi:hypothetical protein